MIERRAIGIIDSGVGGLTVVREVMRQLPREEIIYFGDNARCPYGSRTAEEIRTFTNQMIQFLLQYPMKALVIACNTATAVVLDKVREQLDLPVIGVIEPGVRAAISASVTGRIGIIGTETTIRTGAYQRALKRVQPDLYTVGLACPPFVPLVEHRLQETDEAQKIVAETLAPMQAEDVDTLILGCTHYPLLAPLIQQVMGSHITLINSAEETAKELGVLLSVQGILAPDEELNVPKHRFFTSGEEGIFRQIGENWLGRPLELERRELEPLYLG
ncbi:glutamate racemase [Brevibacillus sp. B_LB10_24]|uniref:glutamate racemase n=1 Tax=Brevibacillus sp. B_LB10_24 TaxID=3380645 RepID=UPI0038BD580A